MVWVAGGGSCYDGVVGLWEFGIARGAYYYFIRHWEFAGCLVCCVGILYLFYEP